ncbi:MAG TPA: alpha-1,4-glucan--maltose-1-phosphate maltosyltransferase [Gemmatimonadaceae bacterium]
MDSARVSTQRFANPYPLAPNPAVNRRDRRSSGRGLDHLTIECVTPELDGGRYAVKRVVGDTVWIGADIFKEGHDLLAARALYKGPDDTGWRSAQLTFDFDSDRWYGSFEVDRIGLWKFTVEGWTDAFGTWRAELRKKVDAEQVVDLELLEGALLVRAAARRAKSPAVRASLLQTARIFEDRKETTAEQRTERAFDEELLTQMNELFPPRDVTCYPRELGIYVDTPLARFAAWYELFPRSQAPDARHGTFDDAARRLPRLAEIGYDVIYLPPIHPIGRKFRKGKNNSLTPDPEDVGSPWAIGNENGGHTAIEPALGTVEDFERFVQTANSLNLEIALDYALQCSPDHPWVKEHPDWFHIRPDGSIKYAENPPKKYQDIYPINFWCDDRENLWNACRDIFLFWIGRGVKIFRVDNPHTKPLAFWEWVIGEVQREHPDTIFFAEAFTRPKKMKSLGKLGFTMSYTYFTWKNTSWDLREYLDELTNSPMVEYFRGNLFANTPDILNEYLVHGGPAAFRIRLLLAATLLPLYGLYSGYELYENVPQRPGSEEYLDSEKYQIKPRDWEAPGNLNAMIQLVNRVRRENPALQQYDNLSFHRSENPQVLFYRKARTTRPREWTGGRASYYEVPTEAMWETTSDAHDLLIAVTTDPRVVQETMVHVPMADLGLTDDASYTVHDLLTGARYTWRGARNYVRLDPISGQIGHIFRVEGRG